MQLCDLILFALVSQSASCPACCLSHSLVLWFRSNELFYASCLYSLGCRDSPGKKPGASKNTNLLGERQFWQGRGRRDLAVTRGLQQRGYNRDLVHLTSPFISLQGKTQMFLSRNIFHQPQVHPGLLKGYCISCISINMKWSGERYFVFQYYSVIADVCLFFTGYLNPSSRDARAALTFVHDWCIFWFHNSFLPDTVISSAASTKLIWLPDWPMQGWDFWSSVAGVKTLGNLAVSWVCFFSIACRSAITC